MKYKYLLFDADGTLFDYDMSEENALRRTFEQSQIEFSKEYLLVYKKINNELWKLFEKGLITPHVIKETRFVKFLKELNIDLSVDEFNENYLLNLSKQTFLVDGAVELIKSLYKKYYLVIITNGLAQVQRNRFESSQLYKYFNDIIISEEINHVKPSRDYFDVVFEKMNYPDRKDVLVIGDSLSSDMLGGRNYGIDTCWFNPSMVKNESGIAVTYEVASLEEIKQYLIPDDQSDYENISCFSL